MPLPEDLKQQIDDLYHSVGKFLYRTPAAWERGFRLDKLPKREIAVWTRIAPAWERYGEKHGLTSVPEARRIIGALVGISMGCDPCEGLNSIDEDTAKELSELYLNPQ